MRTCGHQPHSWTKGVKSRMRSKMRTPLAIALVVFGVTLAGAQSLNDLTPQLPVSDPSCPYFGNAGRKTASPARQSGRSLSALTAQVAAQLPPVPGGSRTGTATNLSQAGLI